MGGLENDHKSLIDKKSKEFDQAIRKAREGEQTARAEID